MASPLRIFIGWDHRQPVSYTVLQQSIIENAKRPVQITPLVLDTLPIKRQGLTPFTFSRFLVPWLCDYRGWALFLDVDMLVRADVGELFDMADPKYAVMVSKNELRFEWASAMLMNCERCRQLTPEYVEMTPALHKLAWLQEDDIGELPAEWNHLVGYDEPKEAKLVHFTQGIPFYQETANTEYAMEWRQVLERATESVPWFALMGQSIHAKPVHERLTAQINGHYQKE